ncbi:MotA/TolQ/ExbB proton channel family protein [Marinihelvus fidelis]|uniref:MotA/TolQ/ExbB proton channel family protein n=1 Tax=Marinihelvus fidelis TaxID=2613842 RepID=A0A5N0TCW3_9GAMM|nr:MotA/TolQ/ExbB proton channel family protein [Marinihelvus fidelis]KAA9132591.1 MotA/TolQ/ExbB proton channel family protein [Marinihelvus fidelis]
MNRPGITRLIALVISTITAILVIALLARILPPSAAAVLLDYYRATWPFTVQNVLWVAFFIGLGEIAIRWRAGRLEEAQFDRDYLPTDDETVLRPGDDLTPIFRKVRASRYRRTCFVPRLVERCILNFNLSRSVDQTNALLNSSLELFLHELDLRYNIIRYITWLIPSLGFIGTVVGIMMALNYAGNRTNVESPELLYEVTQRLGVAFSTTLLALVMAAILVFLQNLVQGREENTLNRAGQYCLDNLINRLYAR